MQSPLMSVLPSEAPPLRFAASYRAYRFGGRALARWGKEKLPDDGAAESWEVSPYPKACSIVSDGPLRGMTLLNLATAWGQALGRTSQGRVGFPFLLKILDVTRPLPIHVHPTDAQARSLAGDDPGKDEAWYILEANADARVWLGFRQQLSAGEVKAQARKGDLLAAMRSFPVKAGQVVFVPAGTAHAAQGIVFLEIQEVSDRSIFAERVDVWGRAYPDEIFEAELERFIAVVECGPGKALPEDPPVAAAGRTPLGQYPHFAWERYDLEPGEDRPITPLAVGQSWTVIRGDATLRLKDQEPAPIRFGETVAVAAAAAGQPQALRAGPRGLSAVRGMGVR